MILELLYYVLVVSIGVLIGKYLSGERSGCNGHHWQEKSRYKTRRRRSDRSKIFTKAEASNVCGSPLSMPQSDSVEVTVKAPKKHKCEDCGETEYKWTEIGAAKVDVDF